MKLNELSPQQLAQLYRQELTSAFPPEELKPLRSMLSLMEQGRYQALGLDDGGDLVAYAPGGWPSISATASATAGTTAPCSASTTGP